MLPSCSRYSLPRWRSRRCRARIRRAPSRRTTQRERQAWRADAVLGEMLQGLQSMDAGVVSGVSRPDCNVTKADHAEMDRLEC